MKGLGADCCRGIPNAVGRIGVVPSDFGALGGVIPNGVFGDAGLGFNVPVPGVSPVDLLSALKPETGEPANGELRAGRVSWRPNAEDGSAWAADTGLGAWTPGTTPSLSGEPAGAVFPAFAGEPVFWPKGEGEGEGLFPVADALISGSPAADLSEGPGGGDFKGEAGCAGVERFEPPKSGGLPKTGGGVLAGVVDAVAAAFVASAAFP